MTARVFTQSAVNYTRNPRVIVPQLLTFLFFVEYEAAEHSWTLHFTRIDANDCVLTLPRILLFVPIKSSIHRIFG